MMVEIFYQNFRALPIITNTERVIMSTASICETLITVILVKEHINAAFFPQG